MKGLCLLEKTHHINEAMCDILHPRRPIESAERMPYSSSARDTHTRDREQRAVETHHLTG